MSDTPSNVDHVKAIQAEAAFIQFDRRAEKLSQDILARTFVDAEPLFIQLSSRNHQVLYGRRGTGKTHALKFQRMSAQRAMPQSTLISEPSVQTVRSILTRSAVCPREPRAYWLTFLKALN
jgi:hypothetical protein